MDNLSEKNHGKKLCKKYKGKDFSSTQYSILQASIGYDIFYLITCYTLLVTRYTFGLYGPMDSPISSQNRAFTVYKNALRDKFKREV